MTRLIVWLLGLLLCVSVAGICEDDTNVCSFFAGADSVISLAELQTAISYWQTQEPLPESNGYVLTSSDLMTLVGLWRSAAPCEESSFTYSEATIVFTSDDLEALLDADENLSSMTFERNPQTESIEVGDILLSSASSAAAPYGFLRRVTGVSGANGELVFETEQGTLEEAFEHADIVVRRALTVQDVEHLATTSGDVQVQVYPQAVVEIPLQIAVRNIILVDEDGNHATTNDQVTADGILNITPYIELEIHISWFQLQRVVFILGFTGTLELEIEATLSWDLPDWETEIARVYWAPIILPGVFFQPVSTLSIGIEGEVYAGVRASVEAGVECKVGLRYSRGIGWTPVSEFEPVWDHEIRPTAGVSVRGYSKLRNMLLVYGIIGPYIHNSLYLELDFDLFRDFMLQLYGGYESGAGFRAEILGIELVDYEVPRVIDVRLLLWEGLEQGQEPESGTIRGAVRDAVTDALLDGVLVQVRDPGLVAEGLTTNGAYEFDVPVGSDYVVGFHKLGYLSEEYHDVDVEASEDTILETVLQVDETYAGNGSASGRVVNAVTALGVADLDLQFRRGINETIGPVVSTTQTGADGHYTVDGLSAGSYTAEATGDGYTPLSFTVVVVGGVNTPDQDAAISPILSPNELRIVLEWGAAPFDLDSHFTGPVEGGGTFHMYYWLAEENNGTNWPGYVTLDVDDTDSYGPETTTLMEILDGTYRFSVHDYTNKDSVTSTALAESSAQVRVYQGSSLLATFNVPPAEEGTLWVVFEIQNGDLVAINEMGYESSPISILSTGNASNGGTEGTAWPVKGEE